MQNAKNCRNKKRKFCEKYLKRANNKIQQFIICIFGNVPS